MSGRRALDVRLLFGDEVEFAAAVRGKVDDPDSDIAILAADGDRHGLAAFFAEPEVLTGAGVEAESGGQRGRIFGHEQLAATQVPEGTIAVRIYALGDHCIRSGGDHVPGTCTKVTKRKLLKSNRLLMMRRVNSSQSRKKCCKVGRPPNEVAQQDT